MQQTELGGAAGWAGDLARRGERGGGVGKIADRDFLESGKARIAGECVFSKTMPIGDLEQMSHSRTITWNTNINANADKIEWRGRAAL